MIPRAIITLALLFFTFFSNAQLLVTDQDNSFDCAQTGLHQHKLQNDQDYKKAHKAMEEQLYQWQNGAGSRNPAPYTLPVVVHIIHNNGPENISDAQVQDAMQHLNDAFANLGYYNPATGVNTQISFCLARRDPDGNATTGINRVQSPLANFNYNVDDQSVKDLSRWNPLEYINVWVVDEICNNNGCSVAGYAYLPGAHGASFDGIVLEANWMGSNPTNSTVLVHEMGHYLGLYHTFEGGCPNDNCQLNGDRVCDTPPDNTTARPSCPTEMNSCTSDEDDMSANNPFRSVALGGIGDQPDMKENYMDYSRFQCYDRFSQGQTDRMYGVIENIRHSLLDSPACLDPCPVPFEVGFSASATSVPVGTTVNFTNTSTADSYDWSINGSPISTNTDISFTFNNEGSFEVTLSAFSNLSNCLPKDSTITIDVFCPVEAGIMASDSVVLAGATVSFTNTSTNATDYTWLINGAVVSNDFNYTLNTTGPGYFNICLQASNGLCEDTQCIFVTAQSVAGGEDCKNAYYYTYSSPEGRASGRAITPAIDGGYYIGGSLNLRSVILKINESGEIEWQYQVPFSNHEEIWKIAEDEDGNIIAAGQNKTDTYGYCFKFDPQAQSIVWANYFNTLPESRFNEILIRPDLDYYIILGQSDANPISTGPGCDATFTMIDKNTGNVINQRHYSLGSCEYFEGAIMIGNDIYATGRYNNAGGGNTNIRPGITRINLNGDIEWVRLYLEETPGADARLYSTDIVKDDNSFVLNGYGDFDGNSASDVTTVLYKTDLDGNLEWAKSYEIPGVQSEKSHMIFNQPDGYLLVGDYKAEVGTISNQGSIYFIKTDKNGNLQWAKEWSDNNDNLIYNHGAFQRNENIYLTGTTINSNGSSQLFYLRINPDGSIAGDCNSLTPIEVEESTVVNPYDGFHQLDHNFEFIRPHEKPDISPVATSLSPDNICTTPCENPCGEGFYFSIGGPQLPEAGQCVIPASGGGFFLGGRSGNQSLIAKLDENGQFIWQKTFSNSDGQEQVFNLIEDGQYLVGTVWINNNTDHYLFKYDLNSESFAWIRTYTNSGSVRTYDIINPSSSSTNYIITGYLSENTPEGCNLIWGSVDKNTGNLLDIQQYSLGSCETGSDALLVGDRIYVTGRYNAAGGGFFAMRPAITELELDGTENWTRLYLRETPNATARLYSSAIIRDETKLIVSGQGDLFNTSASDITAHIFKTAIDGSIEWARIIDVPGGTTERLATLVDQGDGYLGIGSFIPFGSNEPSMLLVKVDDNGNLLWVKTLDDGSSQNIATKGAFSQDGYAYITGTRTSGSNDDIFLMKVNQQGELEGGCEELQDIVVESWLLENPFDGFFDLSQSPFNPNVFAGQAQPTDSDLPADPLCYNPCEEICANGIDDDEDGLIDCEDEDCPCFVDCGNTYVKALGQPQSSESLAAILQSSDGFLYAGGNSGEEGLLLKLSTEGEVLSQQQFDFTPGQDRILSMIEDGEGYIVGAGFGQSTSNNERNGFVFKYDPISESILWSNAFSQRAGFWSVNINPANGNYLAAGAWTIVEQNAVIAEFDKDNGNLNWTNEVAVGVSDAYYGIVPVGNVIYLPNRYTLFTNADDLRAGITALDGNGNHQWSKYYLTPQNQSARQYSFGMVQDDGGLTTSYIGDPNGGSLANSKSGLIRTDYAGNLEWSTEYDVAGMDSELSGYGLAKTPDGYLLYGYSSAGGNEDIVIIKTDKSGNALWARKYGGLQEDDILFNADNQIFQAGDYIYLVGRSRYFDGNEDAIIIKANASDGSVNADDCIYTELLDVSTTFLPAFESNQDVDQNDFTDLINQVSTPAASPVDLTCEAICLGSNLDLAAIIDTAYCNGDSLAMELQICNEGVDTLMSGTPYTVYDGNPTVNATASILGNFTIPVALPGGECFNSTIALPYPNGTMYLMANDDGSLPLPFDLENDFPSTPMVECDYTNNLDSATYDRPIPDIDLGPDTNICENGVFLLDAGPGFVSYEWQDGSIDQTYTAFEAGTYWVTGTTACGDVASDTINIILDNDILIALGPDPTICAGESVSLSTADDPDYTYQWTPSANLDCDDCPTVIASPDTTTTYELAVSNSTGCVSLDSVTVMVEACTGTLDTAICLGDSLLIEGQALYPNTMDTIPLMDGSELIVNVVALDTFFLAIDLGVCSGDSVEYDGITLQPAQSELFSYTAATGCDSTIEITALELDTFYTIIDTAICLGQTLDYNGTTLLPGDSQSFSFTASNGCDSTVQINVSPLDTFYLAIDLGVCAGDSVEYEGTILLPGESEIFNYTSVNGCDSTVEVTALELDTFFTAIDTAICEGQTLNYNGTTLLPGDSQSFSFTAENGCDSIVQINVNALDTFYLAIDLGVCAGDSLEYDGMTLLPGQSEIFTYTSVNGCDSTVEVTALELDTFYTEIYTSICAGQSLDYNGTTLLPGDDQTFSFTAENGCDSTVLVSVGQLDTFYTVIDTAVCAGQNFEYNGSSIMPESTQSFSFTAGNGCDSTVQVNVGQLDTFFTVIDTAICEGQTLDYNGTTLMPGDTETFGFTAENGCDSMVMVSVSQLDTIITTLVVETCFEEPYLYNGTELSPNSTTPFTFSGANGCDSTVIVTVNELELIETYETLQACQDESVDIFGTPTFEQGIYDETYPSAQGCDSTHIIYFVVIDTAELYIPPGQLECLANTGSLTVEITGGDAPYEVEWSDGQTTETATGLAPGQYSVTVTTAFGCQSVGTGTVVANLPIIGGDVNAQSITCFGDNDGTITLTEPYGGTPPYQYSLDGINYQSENIFTNLAAGEYTLYLRDDKQCDTSYTILIEEPDPIELELPADTTLYIGDSLRIIPAILSGKPTDFSWQPPRELDCPSCPSVTAKPSESVTYTLIARDSSGCEGEDEILILIDKKVRVYIPNAFSPNGDGRNDLFTIYTGSEVVRVNSLQVFSRWGEQVYLAEGFIPNRADIGWDGNFRGEPMGPAVFVYFVEVELVDGRSLVFKGEVVLVR